MAFLSGINAPTGKTSVRDNDGMLFAASDQPGKGSWSPFGGLVFTKKWDKFLLSANLFYSQGTEGTQNTTLGSLFDYSLGAVFKLYNDKNSQFNLDGILELNGEYAAKDKVEALSDSNSGGNSIFLISGIRANVSTKLSIYLGVNLPLLEKYNGTQEKIQYGAISGIDLSI